MIFKPKSSTFSKKKKNENANVLKENILFLVAIFKFANLLSIVNCTS